MRKYFLLLFVTYIRSIKYSRALIYEGNELGLPSSIEVMYIFVCFAYIMYRVNVACPPHERFTPNSEQQGRQHSNVQLKKRLDAKSAAAPHRDYYISSLYIILIMHFIIQSY